MAEFPRYLAKGQLTTQAPSPMAPAANAGQGAQDLAKVGTSVQDAAVKWGAAVDTVQKTTATAGFKTGLLDIAQRAQNDPDYNNSAAYLKEIDALKARSLEGFSSPAAQAEARAQLDYDGRVAQIQVENLYKKKLIDVGQASTLQLIDGEVNSPTEASLPNVQKLLNAQVSAGVIGHEDAYKLLRKANEDLGVNRVNRDLYQAQTPEEVDAVTARLTSGDYERGGVTMEPAKKKSLLDVADRARQNVAKRQEAQAAEALTQNRVDTITSIASGKVPLEGLNLADIAGYDPQLAGTLGKVKDFLVNYNPKLAPAQQALSSAGLLSTQQVLQMKSYARSITDTFMQDDNQALGDFVLRELDKHGDGLTSSVKLAAFVNLASLKARANSPQAGPDQAAVNRYQALWSGVRFLQAANPYAFPQLVADFVVRNYLSGGASDEQVLKEARATLKTHVLARHPALAALPSLPNRVVTGDAPVEDVQAGPSDLKEGQRGSYADQPSD